MELIFVLFCQIIPPGPEQAEPTPIHPVRKILIYLDESPRSNLLRAELTGNWNRNGTPQQIEWQRRQAKVMECVKIVEHRRSELASYPRWARTGYQQTQEFDRRAFSDSAMALRTVEVILFNENVDETEWKARCWQLTENSKREWIVTAKDWLKDHDVEDWPIVNDWCSEWMAPDDELFEAIQTRYRYRGNFPQFVEPELPPNPCKAWPWE